MSGRASRNEGGASGIRAAITGHAEPVKPLKSGTLQALRESQNPTNLPAGPGTGRCPKCGASGEDMWDSEEQEGCDICSWLYNKVAKKVIRG